MIASRSRGTARSARPAIVMTSWKVPAGRARATSGAVRGLMSKVTLAVVMTGPPFGVEVGAGQLEEHVVERRACAA